MEIYVEDLKRLAFLDNKSSAAAFEASPHLEVFKIADSNSTSIGEYIGYNEYLSVVEYLVSLRSRRTVCPLGNYLGLDSGGVTLRYTVLQDFWN
jgi:hypothetical protein